MKVKWNFVNWFKYAHRLIIIEDQIRLIKDEYNYEEVPIEDFYDSK